MISIYIFSDDGKFVFYDNVRHKKQIIWKGWFSTTNPKDEALWKI